MAPTPPAPPKLAGPGGQAVPPTVAAARTPQTAATPEAAHSVAVDFVPGSSVLPPGAVDVLKNFAATRGQSVIAVTGYGDAGADDPRAQSAALSLALARAQAVAKALAAAGVPQTSVRIAAAARGRGANVRLVQ